MTDLRSAAAELGQLDSGRTFDAAELGQLDSGHTLAALKRRPSRRRFNGAESFWCGGTYLYADYEASPLLLY